MSETSASAVTGPSAPPVPSTGNVQAESTFDHFIAGCHHAAALVYHDMVAAEARIVQWRSDNPAVSAIFDQATQYVEDLLTAHGIPVLQGVVVVKTIAAALKEMAASDPTVQSGASTAVSPAT